MLNLAAFISDYSLPPHHYYAIRNISLCRHKISMFPVGKRARAACISILLIRQLQLAFDRGLVPLDVCTPATLDLIKARALIRSRVTSPLLPALPLILLLTSSERTLRILWLLLRRGLN